MKMSEIEITSKEWMTAKQLEAEFGITRRVLSMMRIRKNMEKEGALPFTKVGGRILYLRSDVNEWLLSNKRGGKQ